MDSATIVNSVVGLRARIGKDSHISESIVMGADYYEPEAERREIKAAGRIPVGIGARCTVKKAILDKNVRIGDGCVIANEKGLRETETERYVIRDGIVIVYKTPSSLRGR